MRQSAFSLKQYAAAYDAMAVLSYGFSRVTYPRNLGTYAMNPRTGELMSLIPRLIPQIPYEFQINFIKSGIAHESGHLINRNSLCKATDLLGDKSYRGERNRKTLHSFFNAIVDVAHERCQAEKYCIDGAHFYIFWSHIEDNSWALKKQEVIDEKGKVNEDLTKEVDDLWDLQRYIMLTERNITPRTFDLPERYKKRWAEIEAKVLPTIRKTYDSVKILDVAKIFYDIIMEESPNFKEQCDKKSNMKIKITKIKGSPAGMSLGEQEIDLSDFDPENIEIEEMDWEDFQETLGEDREEFQGKVVKNKNSDNFEEDLDKDSSHSHFEGGDEGPETEGKATDKDRKKQRKGNNCPARENEKRTPKDQLFDPPIHQGEGEKIVINDFDILEIADPEPANYQAAFNQLTDLPRLTAILSKKLTSIAKDEHLINQTKGRIDPRKLAKIVTMKKHPQPPVFKVTKYSRAYKNTKVSLLIDESGSMCGSNKYYHARCAAILFGEVLNRINIDFELIGFTTGHKPGSDFPSCVNRKESLHHILYKSFREPWATTKQRVGGICARSSNCDGESVFFAGMRLAQQKADRRVLFVFSDGYPAGGCYYDMDEDLKRTVKLLEMNRIEVYGIGVCSTAVQEYYTNWLVIEDARTLSQEFYQKLDQVLSQTK